jgi:hypothetical protein
MIVSFVNGMHLGQRSFLVIMFVWHIEFSLKPADLLDSK